MTSLLERMNIPANSVTGPTRHKLNQRTSAPYNRNLRPPKGDVDSPWTHDLYDAGSLSARLAVKPGAPKINLNTITQKAIREATSLTSSQLSIKGAGSVQGNVVEVSGLVSGTTAEDVAAIFKRCGDISSSKLVSGGEEVRIRLTFKLPASAVGAVRKFHNQPADGKLLSVRIVGSTSAGTTLSGRLGGSDGLGLVREEGSVDVLIDAEDSVGSKMRSDSLRGTPRAQVLLAPPGADLSDYIQTSVGHRGGIPRGRGGRGERRGRRGGQGLETQMDTE